MKATYTLYIAVLIITAGFLGGCSKDTPAPTAQPEVEMSQVEVGMKIAKEWRCSYCHTPEIAKDGVLMPDPERLYMGHPANEMIPEIPDMIMTSPEYMEFLDNLDTTVWATDDRIVFTANLTPDKETGIGSWTQEEFLATIRSGRHQGVGKRLKYPMPWQELAALNDEELAALFAYLQTVKPINNKVPESIMLFR